jgi:hypothetical protein
MIKRLTWFATGAVAGALGAGAAKRRVKARAQTLSPVRAVRGAGHRIHEAVTDGRSAMRVKEAELRARRDGRSHRLADELAEGDAVLVDGVPVEPGQVIVLRQAHKT